MVKKYKPTTPSRRHMTGISYRNVLVKKKPEKSLTFGRKRAVGRNNQGRITMRHKGGGHKKLFRMVDFKYNKKDIPAKIKSIEYDPLRSGFIALAVYRDGEKRYVLAPARLKSGDDFIVSEKAELKTGNRLPLFKIPVGSQVYNVELKPNQGAKLGRSAGNYLEILAHDGKWSNLKMPSKEVRKVLSLCWANIGQVSNEEHGQITIGKAGRSRHLGIRPTVRGSAMNPVDHPYGGGEGRAKRGTKRPKDKWGNITGGRKTRKKKKYSKKLILQKRKK
ncbi:MAG: 50S ribosomal protein L2 [Parcubacteria group bacterium GW2011_GWB1_41_6]|nr:MAG: 50S ribosomal protein L2 [Parcubacteria group bacterium GW2011_GWB1_41_6]